MSFVIGTVNALVGQVIAVAEDGSSRTLKLGDAVLNTEVIRTVEGAQIEVALANGEEVSIANAGEWFAEQALTPQTLAQIQFQSTPIGIVNSVSGNAVAVAADGSERALLAGDSIYPGEIIRTSPDSAIQIAVDGASPITIGGGDSWVATSDTYTPTQDFDPTAAASSDIDAIQAAILAGVDPTQNAEATAAGGETPTEDGGSSFVTLERTAAEVNPEAGFDTVGLNQTITPFNEEPAFVAALILSTPEEPYVPTDGRNTAQFTDNFVNGVEYYNYESKSSYDADANSYTNSGLTGDRGTPGSFSYTPSEFIVFKIGAVIVAEFAASQIDGPYLFIQDLTANYGLEETNDWMVENIAILLQALDSDLQDSSPEDQTLQTNDVVNSDAAFSTNINITPEIRAALAEYVDPTTGEPLDMQTADKRQLSDVLNELGIEFTRVSEIDIDGASEGEILENNFETLAMEHVVGTIEEIAGSRTPEQFVARTADVIQAEAGTILVDPRTLEADEAGFVEFTFNAANLRGAGTVGQQVHTENMEMTLGEFDPTSGAEGAYTYSDPSNPLTEVDVILNDEVVGTVTYDAEGDIGTVSIDTSKVSIDELKAGALEQIEFPYTLFDWTAYETLTAGVKGIWLAEYEDVDESADYSVITLSNELSFDEDLGFTVKFSPEGAAANFAEYSDDFRVPIEYSTDGGVSWNIMDTVGEYFYESKSYDYDKPLPVFGFTLAASTDSSAGSEIQIRIPIFDDVKDEDATAAEEKQNTAATKELIDVLIEGVNGNNTLPTTGLNVQPGIIDNDPTELPYVDVDFVVVSEGDETAELTISLHNPDGSTATADGEVTVTYSLIDLSATGGPDSAINSGNDYVDGQDTYEITIPDGESSFVVSIDIIDDLLVEATEFALIDLVSVTGRVVGETNDLVIGDPQGTIRIYDNDALNVVGQRDYEGNDAIFSVTVDPEQIDAGAIITLRPTNSGASATPVDDFDPTTLHAYTLSETGEKVEITLDENLSFELAGREQFYVAYETIHDQVIEAPETVRIQVSAEFLDDQGDQVQRVGLGTATVVDPILAANDADSFTETELETGLTISGSINVLTNDTEPTPDAEALKVQPEAVDVFTSDGQTVIGVVNFAEDGSYTLTLNADGQSIVDELDTDESLTVEADYTAENQDGVTDTATLKLTINGTNDKPTITSESGNPEGANDVVYESGLTSGSSPSAANVVATGTITVADPDGLDDIASITIDSDTFTVAQLNAATAGSPLTVTGDKGTLSITDYTDGVATYSYTLTSAVDDDEVGASTQEVFSVTTSDGTLSSDPASITIDIADDAPRADDDANSLGEDDASTSGNVFGVTNASTNDDADIAGADVATVTAVRTGAEDASGTTGTIGAALQGTYGTLTLGADGQYTYSLTADMSGLDDGESRTDTFTYTITDGDGETDAAALVVTINGSNDKPTISTDSGNPSNANDTVYEAGLASGSGIGSTDVTVGGTITVADPDGLDDIASITIDSDTFTVAQLNAATSDAPLTVTGDKGMLSITDYTDGVATYSYTLTSAVDDDEVGASTQEVFSVTTSDGTLSSDPASITIDIVDDAPVANNDTADVTAGSYTAITGDVMTNDVEGADGATVTSVAGTAVGGYAGAYDYAIQGTYGVLELNADGTYQYTRDAGTPGGVDDTFTYTLTDADGDFDTADLVISIGDSGVTTDLPVDTTTASITVDEDGLDTDGNNDTGETATGSFTYTAADTPVDITIGGVAVVTSGVVTGNTIPSGSHGDLTVTGFNASTGTLSYSYTLTSVVTDTTTTQDGDNTVTGAESFVVVVSDEDGDFAAGNINVAIVDDVPAFSNLNDSGDFVVSVTAPNVATTHSAQLADWNYGADNSGVTYSLSSVSGSASIDTAASSASAIVVNLLDGSNTLGTLTLNADGTDSLQVFSRAQTITPVSLGTGTVTASGPDLEKYINSSSGLDVTITASDGVAPDDFAGLDDVNPSRRGWAVDDNQVDPGESLTFAFSGAQVATFSFDVVGFTGGNGTDGRAALSITVNYAEGGSKTVSESGAQGTTFKSSDWGLDATKTISSVTILSAEAAGGDGFRIDNVQAGQITTTNPVDLDYAFTLDIVDGDGDRASQQFSVKLSGDPSGSFTTELAAPIALDLDQDGTEYLSREAGVVFTDQSTGESANTAWVGPDDGLLVIDANNSGTVDESREYVFTEWSETAETDMEAIAEVFDTNQDGVLDAQDDQWDQFRVWQDKDSDGQTDEGELVSLGDLMIESIDLTYVADSQKGTAADGDVVIHGQSAVTYTDGSTTIAEDTSFAISEVDLLNTEDLVFEKSKESSANPSANSSDASVNIGDLDINDLLHKVVDDGTV